MRGREDHAVELGKHVLDKELLDSAGHRAGKVDDLLLTFAEPDGQGTSAEPEVVAIVNGPLALAQNLPGWVQWLARQAYHLLGVAQPAPVEIPWSAVTAIDVVVHLSLPREQGGWHTLAEGVRRRYIDRLPGA
jgi:sporulation protein YlmC with PRC-barrel domain